MTTCLGKSCSFGLPLVPFVNCCQFMYLVNFPFGFLGQDVGSDCISSHSLLIFLLFISFQCACGKSFIVRKPEVHPKIF